MPWQYYQSETGLNYNWNRDYDPLAGSYIESDPIGLRGGIATYAYAYDSAPNYRDPSGRFAIAIPLPFLEIPAPPPVLFAGTLGFGAGTLFNYVYESFAGQSLGSSIYDWTHPEPLTNVASIRHADAERKAAEDECFEECEHHMCGRDPGPFRLCFNSCMKRKGFDTGLGPTHVEGP